MAKSLKKVAKTSMLRKKITKDKSAVKRSKARLNQDRTKLLSTAVVSSVKKAWGSKPVPKMTPAKLARVAWDATNPFHLALPVTTGPYQVVRLTKAWTSPAGSTVTIFGPCVTDTQNGGRAESWENIIAVENVGPTSTSLNATSNCKIYTLPASSLAAGTTLVPSAFTVTVMNGNALQTTSGVCYMGRYSMCPTLGDSSRTWDTLGDNFIAFHAPRLLSASKLAMGAVRCSAVPSNMATLSNFSNMRIRTDEAITWNSVTAGDFELGGFSPIVFIKPNGLTLTYEVTVEFRLRFDPDSVASSTHVHHKAVPDTFWNDAMAAAINAGHGVYDIAEATLDVADAAVHA
jgi:hypothetical protein